MISTFGALMQSRKFWVGTITVLAMVGAVVLRVTGKIGPSDLLPTILGLSATGSTLIGAIAWEDGKKLDNGAQPVAPARLKDGAS